MNETTRVALYALVYREAYKNRCWSSEGLLELVEIAPGDVSLATLLGSQYLSKDDWNVLHQLDEPSDFMRVARHIVRDDPFRAEVLLHACPPRGRRSERPWAAALVARWDAVVDARWALRDDGLTATRNDVEELATSAYVALGGDLDEHEAWLDEVETEYANG